jgi:hypothetical protein
MKKNLALIILVVVCVVTIPTFIYLGIDKWQQSVEKQSDKVAQNNEKTNKKPEKFDQQEQQEQQQNKQNQNSKPTDDSNQLSKNTDEKPDSTAKRPAKDNPESEEVDSNQENENKQEDPDTKIVDMIHTKVEDELANLRSACESKLNSLYQSYQATKDKTQQNRYISDGFRELGNCDNSFNQIMVNYSSEMMELGIDPKSRVASYRNTYETIKNNKILELDPNR